jgi:hypothetical protein
MNLSSLLSLLKSLIPVLEPIGEQGVNQLFTQVNAWVASVSSPDEKLVLQFLVPALQQFVIAELQKLKS